MLFRSLGLVLAASLVGSLGCLRVFGPDLRARDQHAGLAPDAVRDACMGCHVSELEAIAAGVDEAHPASAPIVADWMLDERRECVSCHRVHVVRARARTTWQLGPLDAGRARGVADAR